MQPNVPEEQLDHALIDQLNQYSCPTRLTNGWCARIECHFIGRLRHYLQWEIADIGLLVSVKQNGRSLFKKAGVLQSKRLYPHNRRVIESTQIEYEIGMARLDDPELDSVSLFELVDFEFNDGCRYEAIKQESDQIHAIDSYMSNQSIPVYYQLYNPPSLPLAVRLPLCERPQVDPNPQTGIRILRATDVHLQVSALSRSPSVSDFVASDQWRLENFVADELLACREGHRYERRDDPSIQNLFYRRNGPISAAVAISLEAPPGVSVLQ